ncbi:hypothetical protein L7F22_006295 [Adiantum nelumboides]|nr:hypothetical protein [Adiantum nelumboides]
MEPDLPAVRWHDRVFAWKHNPVADAVSRKSSLVQAIQPATIPEIQGLDLDCMKGEYPNSVEFSTPYNLAMAGLLQPLPIPDGPFEDVSMDFVGPLPTSHPSTNTMCFTIVDWFSKFVMLISWKYTSLAQEIARLFIRFWYPITGLPKTITSDRDTKFTSQFWKSLFDNFGTRLQFSSAFHPQTDVQTEIYNLLAFDVLKAYCHDQQNRWDYHLPLVEAILNDTYSSSIGQTPYEAAFGKRFSSLLTRIISPSVEANRVVESYSKIVESVKDMIAVT